MSASVTETTTKPIWFIDCVGRILVSGEESEGRISLVEMLAPRGHMPPLHLHYAEDETFFLAEGEVTLYVGANILRLSAGEAAFAPKGIPHTFRVESETARWHVAATPSGFERFVATVGEETDAYELPTHAVMSDPEEFARICDVFGIELLGPPGTLPS